MRTLILLVACVGIGYGIARVEFQNRTAGIKNVMGAEEDMKAALEKAKSTVTKPGKIEVLGGPELDFGTMRLGTERAHNFVFKNVGGTPVELQYKTASCKCTVGKLDKKTLAPDEETSVELKWLAEGSLSEFAQTATIATNAIDQEEIKLTIKGKIGQAHVFSPPSSDLRDFLASEENEIKGRIYSFEEASLEIAASHWSDTALSNKITCETQPAMRLEKGEIPEFAEARSFVDFTIKIGKGIPAGPLTGNLIFNKKPANDDAKEETLNFPVQGRSISPISVIAGPDYNEEKNVFDLGTAKSDEGLKKSLVIRVKRESSKDPEDIQIKVGRISPPSAESALKVSIAEVKGISQKQKMYSVTIEIPAGSPPIQLAGAFSKDFAKIVLETNLESAPQFPMFLKFRILE